MNITKTNPYIDETMANHLDLTMDVVFGMKPEKEPVIKRFRLTIQHEEDGHITQPIFKASTADRARMQVSKYFPRYTIELGCKEL